VEEEVNLLATYHGFYGGTPILRDVIPYQVVDALRIILWCSTLFLIGRLMTISVQSQLRSKLGLGRIALIVLLIYMCWMQAHNWDAPMGEGLITALLANVFTWAAVYRKEVI
jgi:hypothetical protein